MSGELIARLNAYPKMKEVLSNLPPKMLSLASGKEAMAVELEAGDLKTRVDQVVKGIERATFTGKGDKEKVPQMYKEYVSRIAGVLQDTLGVAAAERYPRRSSSASME